MRHLLFLVRDVELFECGARFQKPMIPPVYEDDGKETFEELHEIRKLLRIYWTKKWNDLPQQKIQAWIERIAHHVKEIIRCSDGDEFKVVQGRIAVSKAGRSVIKRKLLRQEDLGDL
ncbi:uncharacterized protein PADG_06435 [Paracoccidioides brasiliensis Pb18]|uniref:Uncharacterized protein n=1 Tax=Paracoccidioides brasiliensis (strain Pb18) TaxID=502780 RepID=C1GGJ8_PARBD|nr:uncharacterized protein PADG_06435 [Paracoccidioides brasiliensis Pb18]EEH50356.2 hypothetical protein PADG_06435 [Paracoccidioides brasiliensis Pb18]